MTVHKKSLGQHFLQNIGAAHRIVDLLDIESGDRVLEIGPGGGALTGILAGLPITLVAVEIDSRLASELSVRFSSNENVTIRSEDILEFDFASLGSSRSWKLVGNLPYNLTSPILERVFENNQYLSMAVFTVQREVANRLTAEIGTSDYSSLTVFAQTYCDVERVFLLKPGSFFPRPKVSSAVIRLTLRKPVLDDRNRRDGFHRFVQSIFSHRRKTIANCLLFLTDVDKKELLTSLGRLGISPLNRPQNLSLEQFLSLYTAMDEVSNA
jgi:16S rRNA (adenine1518-N6/adenine1519-N6)-dimethyltransferase